MFWLFFFAVSTLTDSTLLRRLRCRLIYLVVLTSESFKDRLVKLSIFFFPTMDQLRAVTSVSLYKSPQRYLPAEVLGGNTL